MGSGGYWWWRPTLEDLAPVGDRAKSVLAVVVMIWGLLGDHANRAADRGSIADIDVAAMAAQSGKTVAEILRVLAALTEAGLIDGATNAVADPSAQGGASLVIGTRLAGAWWRPGPTAGGR